ncbi:TPA: hypothetical protein ACH3X2_009825 [Trebouxia sp. C0005]
MLARLLAEKRLGVDPRFHFLHTTLFAIYQICTPETCWPINAQIRQALSLVLLAHSDDQAMDALCFDQTDSYNAGKSVAAENKTPPQPLQEVTTLKGLGHNDHDAWTNAAYKLIAEGRAAVLLLTGGQGTRLGSSAPKGCHDIGLPSHKSLFQLQAERLIRLQQLAAEAIHGQSAKVRHPVRWHIMTSPPKDAPIKEHFKEHRRFGLGPDQLFFPHQASKANNAGGLDFPHQFWVLHRALQGAQFAGKGAQVLGVKKLLAAMLHPAAEKRMTAEQMHELE